MCEHGRCEVREVCEVGGWLVTEVLRTRASNMPLATLPGDAIQRILYATTPSEWKSIARQACVLSCVCTDLRVAVRTWARAIANAMRYRRGPDPRMPWTLASSTLREPMQFVCREARAVRFLVSVPYYFFNPRVDYTSIYTVDSVANHVWDFSGFGPFRPDYMDGRPWEAALLRGWMFSVRRKSKEILLIDLGTCYDRAASKLCVRIAALDRNGGKIAQPLLDPVIVDLADRPAGVFLGKYMHVQEDGKKPRLLTEDELGRLNLERDDGTFRLEVYIAEL